MNARHNHHPRQASLVIAGAVMALGGCAGTSSHLSAAAPFDIRPASGVTVTFHAGNGAEVLSDGTMILPLDRYDPYMAAANEALVYEATTALEQACMRASGLTLPDRFGALFLPTEASPLSIYGVATLTDAAHWGYRLPGSDASGTPTSPVAPNVAAAFDGQPGKPGCAEQAATTLSAGESADAYGYIEDLRSRALSAVYRDRRVAAANASWSTCMKANGYSYLNPLTAADDTSLSGGVKGGASPPPSPREKAAAIVDVNCKHAVGYLNTFAQVAADYQNQLIRDNGPRLRQVLVEWHDVLRKAAAVVHNSAP